MYLDTDIVRTPTQQGQGKKSWKLNNPNPKQAQNYNKMTRNNTHSVVSFDEYGRRNINKTAAGSGSRNRQNTSQTPDRQ